MPKLKVRIGAEESCGWSYFSGRSGSTDGAPDDSVSNGAEGRYGRNSLIQSVVFGTLIYKLTQFYKQNSSFNILTATNRSWVLL